MADPASTTVESPKRFISARVYPGFVVFDCQAYLETLPVTGRQKVSLTWVANGAVQQCVSNTGVGYLITPTAGDITLTLFADGVAVDAAAMAVLPPPGVVAFAGDEAALIAACLIPDRIVRLNADVAINSTVRIARGTTLDLAAHALTWSGGIKGTNSLVQPIGDGVTVCNGFIDVANATTNVDMPRFIAPATKGVLLRSLTIRHIGTGINCSASPEDVVVSECTVDGQAALINNLIWAQGRAIVIDRLRAMNSVREHIIRAAGFKLLAVLNCTLANTSAAESGVAGDIVKTHTRFQHGDYAWESMNIYGPGQADRRPLGGNDGLRDAPTADARAVMRLRWLRSVDNVFTFGTNTQLNVGPRTEHCHFANVVNSTDQPCYLLTARDGTLPDQYGPPACDDITIDTSRLAAGKGKPAVVASADCTGITYVDGQPSGQQGEQVAKIKITKAVLEDIKTGKTLAIPATPIKASAVGTKATVRVETAAAAVRFDWLLDGIAKTVIVPTFTGRARWNKDNGAVFPLGVTQLTLTPLAKNDAKAAAVGDAVTVTLNIAAEAPPAKPPVGTPSTSTDPVPPAKGDNGQGGNAPASTASHLVKGVCTDELLDPAEKVVRLDGTETTVKAMFGVWGVKRARLWQSVYAGQKPNVQTIAKRNAWAKSLGLAVTLCITPGDAGATVPTADQTAAYGKALVGAMAGCDWRGEAVNEPNQPTYWKSGDFSLLSSVFIKPLVDVLHAAGIETIGPSATASPDTVRKTRDIGPATKAQGFHPYRDSVDDFEAMLDKVIATCGGDRVDLTEFNTGLGGNLRTWQVQQDRPEAKDFKAAQSIDARCEWPPKSPAEIVAVLRGQWAAMRERPTIREVDYFILIASKDSAASPLALLQRVDGVLRETVFSRDFWAMAD